jgi:hypothetical protein
MLSVCLACERPQVRSLVPKKGEKKKDKEEKEKEEEEEEKTKITLMLSYVI